MTAQVKPAPTLSECIQGYNDLCTNCGAYDTAERRLKECPVCPIETMRNATLLDETRRLNGVGVSA